MVTARRIGWHQINAARILPTMAPFSYTDCPYPIRPTVAEVYRGSWNYLARAGNWWTGSQRVAIAQACRDAQHCALCAQRKRALSPTDTGSSHGGATQLPDKVVDVVHRVTTDAARLSRAWLASAVTDDFGYGHYVETVSIVVTVLCIDSFHAALGLDLEPLPEPAAGAASAYSPPGAVLEDAAWVPMLQPGSVSAKEADIFAGAPVAANVIRAMSLVPDAVRQLSAQMSAQYVNNPDLSDLTYTGDLTLTRPQIELVAARTSAINDCFY